ncbi:hypothetical protein R1sor_024854 [Riccia sorocarpa]|uniref:AP2/ERF domain-containing protein n=1 Tax=Riccia sorocarpa TaxID=122646 RepID=A0ABD3GRV0_9MARC
MAANSNVGSTNSGSSRRSSSSGGRAGSVASSLSKTLSAGSNVEVNSSETSSGSFSGLTSTSSDSEGVVAPSPMETITIPTTTAATTTVGTGGGMRRTTSASGKNKKRFVGVRQRPSGRWVAEIKDTTQKIRLWLGTFDTAEDAAHAYDEAAWLLRGANTRTNFVPSSAADASVLPSKAARLLQLRKNAAAAAKNSKDNASATTPAATSAVQMNSKPQSQSQSQSQPQNITTPKLSEVNDGNPSLVDNSGPLDFSSLDSASDQATSMGTQPSPQIMATPSSAAAASASPYCCSSTSSIGSSIGNVSAFSGEVAKSESSYESSLEEMCSIEVANIPAAAPQGVFQPDLGGGGGGTGISRGRDDHTEEELVTSSSPYQAHPPPPRLEFSPIRENRKEKDYCSEALPPQENFVDDADMSSGLSGLDDMDLTSVDFVYSTPFDFPMDMVPGLDLGNLISSPLSTSECFGGEEDSLSDYWRRMSCEKQVYAMNGMQECYTSNSNFMPSIMGSQSNAWNGGLSSPSLSIVSLPLDDIWVQEVNLGMGRSDWLDATISLGEPAEIHEADQEFISVAGSHPRQDSPALGKLSIEEDN